MMSIAPSMDQSQPESLSLHFESPRNSAPSLEQQIQQLINERGALRKITIQNLQAEVVNPSFSQETSTAEEVEVENGDEDETPQNRQERLWKSREEMLQKLAYAQNEILSALDFVSLLLSGSSVAAQASMSPALKQLVPSGTLEGRAVEKQDISANQRKNLDSVSEGWKSECFKSASSKFGLAGSRLEGEARRQNRYWDEMARLKTEGWAVSRLPSDSRAIGIHYGFPEAAPQFRSRGFALLHQDEGGSLQCDPRSIPEEITSVRVAIVRHGVMTGISTLDSKDYRQETSIEAQVQKIRDAIFEEELFHEISREARLIANQGARTHPRAIEADIDATTQIRIIQTDLEQSSILHSGGLDDQIADLVSLNLRLLLSLEHTKLKQKRSRQPSMLSLEPQVLPEYALLRPVLTYLRHQACVSALHTACEAFAKAYQEAKLDFEFRATKLRQSTNLTSMQTLRQPSQSSLTVNLQGGRKIEVEIETYLGSPIYGTVFRSKSLDFGFVEYPAGSFSTVAETIEYLSHAMTLELMSQTQAWKVSKPHSGEVMFGGAQKVIATLDVRPTRLSLKVISPKEELYTWDSGGFKRTPNTKSGDALSFQDVVKHLSRKA